MTIEFSKKRITLSGYCTVEDAEGVFDWLSKHEQGALHLEGLENLHSAVLQTLMANPRKITTMPTDAFCAECIRQMQLPTYCEPIGK